MNENPDSARPRGSWTSFPVVTVAAAVIVLLLAIGALLFPGSGDRDTEETLLVLEAPGAESARGELFQALAAFLEEQTGRTVALKTVQTREEFLARASAGVDFALCPDGLALQLDRETYGPLVAGKRKMPTNLRPRGVLVYRQAAGLPERPWVSLPERTVLGDSLSLVSLGGVGLDHRPVGCAFGPDPYDHGPVLHALRLGAFDYALVRQWDADGFFADGLLDSATYGIEMLTPPVPDIVLLASRQAPMVDRVRWAENLALLGQAGQPASRGARAVEAGLPCLGLCGFNLLLEPDFERVRRLFVADWPPHGD